MTNGLHIYAGQGKWSNYEMDRIEKKKKIIEDVFPRNSYSTRISPLLWSLVLGRVPDKYNMPNKKQDIYIDRRRYLLLYSFKTSAQELKSLNESTIDVSSFGPT